jgi:hypothetical protein
VTNKERFLIYTEGLSSPQVYIDWGYRFIIAASLQRRVAYGADPKFGFKPLFANMYGVLHGGPGLGKSLVLDVVSDILKHHKKKDFLSSSTAKTDQEKVVAESIDKANLEDAEATMLKLKRGGEKIEAVLFPYAPDATTYEALVESMSKSGRRINFTQTNPDGTTKLEIYFHCSMYFCLDELGSLFRKKSDSVVNYLLGLHGCPLDYEYKTKNNGEDRVRRGCLNFLAGTTPDFMEEVADDKLIGKGFTARCFFICATKNRKNVDTIKSLTPQQVQCKVELLEHVKKLATLYGEVKVSPETLEWMQQEWDKLENNRSLRANPSPLLDPYYARRNIHLKKVAMMNHFGESTDMFIPIERFVEADKDLFELEKTMHLALATESNNPLAKVTDKIYHYILGRTKTTMVDILTEFWKQLPAGKKSAEDILVQLISTGRIKEETLGDEHTNKVILNYKAL